MTDEEFLDWLEAEVQSSGAAWMTLAVEERQRLYVISGGMLGDRNTTQVLRGYIKQNIVHARKNIAARVAAKLLS